VEDPNVSTGAELSDGRIMINVRNISLCRRRAVAYSSDGGAHFTPMDFAPDLADPKCMGSMCRAEEKLLFTNCCSENGRINLTLSVLNNDATVAKRLQISETGGYSDLCYSASAKRVYVLFECDDVRKLCCAEISLED
jgi:sialidase-1